MTGMGTLRLFMLVGFLVTVGVFSPLFAADGDDPFATHPSPPPLRSGTFELSPEEEGLSPLVSIDYFSRSVENPLLLQRRYRVSARAGVRLSLMEGINLGAGAKLPLLIADQTEDALVGGDRTPLGTDIRSDSVGLSTIGWRGDLNLSVGKRLNLNLFYDYTRHPEGGGGGIREESIGTRLQFIFR